ncbi:MAG: segregation/condensation protein A [Ignavibacteria bacterium]|nr:segregation/condensation protein A [Ignavibacteria bacterium]
MRSFKIKVPDFEGPLDLLLFFIRRDELDIYDIPIAHITREFLDTVRLMQMLDLEVAGEFIVMAATLMQIKARMLLPQVHVDEGEEEADPRAELTRRLLEYKRFKESAVHLQEMEQEQRQRFFRALFKHDVRKADPEDGEQLLKDVTLFHLIAAFQRAMESIPKKTVHQVQTIPYTIEEQGMFLLDFFAGRNEYNFLDIFEEVRDRMQLVVTFIALLELIRAHRVRIVMQADFNNFQIIRETAAEHLPLAADHA